MEIIISLDYPLMFLLQINVNFAKLFSITSL